MESIWNNQQPAGTSNESSENLRSPSTSTLPSTSTPNSRMNTPGFHEPDPYLQYLSELIQDIGDIDERRKLELDLITMAMKRKKPPQGQ